MKTVKRRWWLTLVTLLSLASTTLAGAVDKDKKCDPKHPKGCPQQQVPEGGSTLAYVLGAGVACFGALLIRSRIAKPKAS